MKSVIHGSVAMAGRAERLLKRGIKRALGIKPPPEDPAKKDQLFSIGVYVGTSPLDWKPAPGVTNPVLTRDHVTDHPAAFVADPIVIRVKGTWHMFFEILSRRYWRGEIALATSEDFFHWTYRQVVLREQFHLSYPYVFEWEGGFYMIPETHRTATIRLYRAEEFPVRWKLVETLKSAREFADSTVFRHEGKWWMFTETSSPRKHDTLRLFHADRLFGPWQEHPRSPVRTGDPHGSRPAGRVVSWNGSLVRYAQDCVPNYGVKVNAFEVTALSTDRYEERPCAQNPIFGPSGTGWNESGMHHIDAHPLEDGSWVAAVDGWYACTSARLAARA